MSKKKRNEYLEGTKVPMALAGTSIAFGQAGKMVGSSALQGAGGAAGSFIVPGVNIGVGGNLLKQARKLDRRSNIL